MQDREMHFSYLGALATITGLIAIGLAVTCFFFDSRPVGFMGLHFAIASALFRVRSWLCVLSTREHEAFTLGQDSVRSIR